jgi:amidase
MSAFRDDALGSHDMVGLLAALSAGSVTAEELRQAARARAESVKRLNAVVSWVDEDLAGDGPLAGVPTFLKDNEDVAGYVTTHGSRATPRTPAKSSSRFVKDWQGVGLGAVGKSSLPEFGLTATTEPIVHGPTRNPWDLGHSAGGSSGGSAALVAAGVVPIAHANDGGGSIRIPAACCGLVGLKPSRGRLVDVEAMDMLPVNIVTQGVVTRSVRDTAAFYKAMGQVRRVDDLPPIGVPGDPGRLRIAVITEGVAGVQVDPEVRQAVVAAATLCESLGHHVDFISNPFDDSIARDFLRYWGMLSFSLHRLGGQVFGKDYAPALLEPFTTYLSKYFTSIAVHMPASIRRLMQFAAVHDQVIDGWDVLLSPVLAKPPVPIGYLGPQVDPREHLIRLLQYASFTALQNVAGTPAISLPLSNSRDGLPIGVQFAAGLGQEQLLLDLASTLEQASAWPRIGQTDLRQ